MPLNLLAFALGVWWLQVQAQLPSALWSFALPLLVFLGALWAAADSRVARAGMTALFLASGFLWASLLAHLRLADALPAHWEGRDVELIGVVSELPQAGDLGVRFRFAVEQVRTPLAHVPARISLTWYRERNRPVPQLRAGQRWQLTVRLRRPHGTANPHGFDSEVWMLERGIRAVGYVRAAQANQLLDPLAHRPPYWIERMRERARTRILAALPADPVANVLVALAVGDQPAISAEQWTVFTRTGVNHLMSISGLHITMVSGLVFGFAGWCWRRLPALASRIAAQKAAAVAGLLAGLLYALVSGFGVPAQRTVYMLAVVAAALLFGRNTSVVTVLAAALFAVLLLDPWAVLAAGFWLSFGAVALITYVGLGRLGPGSWLLNWARVQWAITIGLVPLLLALFQQVSLVSPLANAAAIPLVSLGVVPMTLLGLVLPTDGLIVLAGSLMRLCHSLLAALSALPEAVWQQAAPAFWTLPIALAGVVWLLAPRGLPARWLGLVGLLPLVLASAPSPRPGSVWLDVLDVGQGLSSIVRTAHHVLVFDTGPVFSSEADSGSRIVVPHLRGRGMSRVDGLIVSHDDRDHSGGTESLLRATPVRWVASSLPAGDPRLARAERTLPCFAGQAWEWDDVRFEMLHPAWASYNNAAAARDSDSRDNDRSCVLRVVASGGSILLTADIEGTAEAQLLERAATPLSSEVVVVAHHGSATSSSHAFVEHVHPRIAIVPVGHRNRFGHPAAAVLERYARAGAAIYRTDRDGAVLVRLERDITVQTWRGLYRRYWQGR